jgi:hypothetical protein
MVTDGLLRGQQSLSYNGQLSVQISPSRLCAPTFRGSQVSEEIALKINAKRLPEETDGSACKGDIIARLNAVQILEEEPATGETVLLVVLCFQQQQGTLRKVRVIGLAMVFTVPGPETL